MNTTIPRLSHALLSKLQEEKREAVQLPPSSIMSCPDTILQFGFGSFLRGFVADFVQQAVITGDFCGRIVAVQRRADYRINSFVHQDGLYTLNLRGRIDGKLHETNRIIASVSRVLVADTEWERVTACAVNPTTKVILSNVTEAGMALDFSDHPDSSPPRSFPAELTQLLFKRWQATGGQDADVAVIPCELVENNGTVVRSLVLEQARQWRLGTSFSNWLEQSVHFSNTLVDRIVVGTPQRQELEETWMTLGYQDDLINRAEPFYLFALEADLFTHQHFPLDRASPNVRFVRDLSPYRIRKLRILNGSHTVMAALGWLLGHRSVLDVMKDPQLNSFIESMILEEIVPTINLVDDVNPLAYAREVLDRFHNPFVQHELRAICLNSSTKAGIRLFPTLREYIHRFRKLPQRIILGLAAVILALRDPALQDTNGRNIRDRWKQAASDLPQSLESLARDVVAYQIQWSHEQVDLDSVAPAVAQALAEILARGLRSVL